MTGDATDVISLHPLLCGYEIIPETVSLASGDPRIVLAVPITAYLIETRRGAVLFDTALDEGNLHDPVQRRALFTDRGWDPPPVVWPAHEMGARLEALGVGFAGIAAVVLSHMHADHTGHLKRLAHAPLHVQRAELDHAFGVAGPAYFGSDYDLPQLDWHPMEGDTEIMPGLSVLSTPGHTPGHCSLLVELPNAGPVILAADAGDLRRNFEERIAPGEASDPTAALASIDRLETLRRERGARILLTHEPEHAQLALADRMS